MEGIAGVGVGVVVGGLATSGTWSLSQSSVELQDDSSMRTFGSKSSLILRVEEDEVRTTRLRCGFFLHERSTFRVPSTAGFMISACLCQCRKEAKGSTSITHFGSI